MNILFLAHRIPYPPNKGDKIRSFHLLQYISIRGNLFLGSLFDDPRDKKYLTALQNLCADSAVFPLNARRKKILSVACHTFRRPASVCYFYNHKLQDWVDNLLKKKEIDLVFCFSSTMAEYVFRSSAFHHSAKSTIPLLMDFCDVDSVKWVDYAKIKPWPLSSFFRKEGVLLQQYEQRILKEFSHCFLASSREKSLFQKIHDFSDIHVVENGVDLNYFQPTSQETPDIPPPILVFTGAMDYDVNIDGVSWFVHAIWPDIKKYQPDVQFYIVGSNPTQEVLKLADIAGVHVTGYVDDIRSFYNRATICIAPLRIARGIQNKVLEAMAMGKPVICTSNAFEGITAQPDRDLLVYDEPVDFAGQIVTLLAHPERRKQLGRNARLCMESHYSWDSQLSVLDPFLSDTTR